MNSGGLDGAPRIEGEPPIEENAIDTSTRLHHGPMIPLLSATISVPSPTSMEYLSFNRLLLLHATGGNP